MIIIGGIGGGVGTAISGGNFWQGAGYGLIAAGLNHALHLNNQDGNNPPKQGDRKVIDGVQGTKLIMEYTGCGEDGWEIVKIIPGSGAILVTDSPIEWSISIWKTPINLVDDVAILGFAKLSSGSGLSKILLKGSNDIIDLSKFSSKGVYKNWKLTLDHAAGKSSAHGGSYYKLTNTTSNSYRLTLDQSGKILR